MRLSMVAAGAALALFALIPAFAETPPVSNPDDPYLWLEDIHGQKALDWVETENARSLKVLKGDPRYATLHQEALDIVNAVDRIPALID